MQKIRNAISLTNVLADVRDSREMRSQWTLVLFSAFLSGCALALAVMYCVQLRNVEQVRVFHAMGGGQHTFSQLAPQIPNFIRAGCDGDDADAIMQARYIGRY